MKSIRAKRMLAFLGLAVLAVALIWLVQAVFLRDSYFNQRGDGAGRHLVKYAETFCAS